MAAPELDPKVVLCVVADESQEDMPDAALVGASVA
jgi:hypothetical protein